MTYQTHLLRQFHGARPDQRTTPGTSNLVGSLRTLRLLLFLGVNKLVQLDLPD